MTSRTKTAAYIAALVAVVNALVTGLTTVGVITQEQAQAIVELLNSFWGIAAAFGIVFLRDAVGRLEDKKDGQ